MARTVISIRDLSKYYRLGVIGGGTLREDMHRWWAKVRSKPDPLLGLAMADHGNREGNYIWALREINLEVNEGEILGIIGRNGAGKSTLLKILSRITAPTAGRAVIKGRVGSLLEVGTGFHPELTGRENVYLNGAILGMSKMEVTQKLDEIVEFSELSEFIDTPVKRYSSGMRVRLAFAVAAHLEPEILIVDEVLAVGDAGFQRKCIGKMKDVRNVGRTVLFVSHNMQSITDLTTEAVLMDGGSVAFRGETEAAVSQYLTGMKNDGLSYRDRSDKTTPHVSDIKIDTSEPNNVHKFGKPLRIHFRLVNTRGLRELRLALQVMDSKGLAVTHCALFSKEQPRLLEDDPVWVTCRIEAPKLYKGLYTLTVHLQQGLNQPKLQRIDGACPFEIVMWGKSRAYPWGDEMCKYVEDYEWELSTFEQENADSEM